jgi:uncharacterized Zn-binding protein involved in type VI secretion
LRFLKPNEEKDMPYTIEGKEVIVLGDTTTHGGKVITGSENHTYMGIPVARVGDMVQCPKCKGTYPIIEGAPRTFDHGKQIARHGDKVACGATLISRGNVDVPVIQNTAWQDDPGYPRFEQTPPPPPPLTDSEMQPFHKQAEKQGLGDKKTLAQYIRVQEGVSLNSGHSNGWESYDVPVNGEALIYVKNVNPTPIGSITPVNVRAGVLLKNVQEQQQILISNREHIFRFTNNVGYWYISIGASTDVYMLKFEVWTRQTYAN